MTHPLPCTSRLDVYDALFDDEDEQARAAALPVAIALCASCPAPCPEKVTAASRPRTAGPVLADADVMDVPVKPVRKPSRIASWSATHPAEDEVGPWYSEAYVPPAARVPAAAVEAAELAGRGLTVGQVAERLCVTVETAVALLRLAGVVRQLAVA